MFKFYLLTALFFALLCTAHAQNNEYQFSQLDISNGLSNNRVNCIYKDYQGFMWFGTTSGLSRYDGYEFKIFKHNTSNPNSLFSNYVEKIYEGPGHSMWTYTNNGISVYDPNTEKFSNDVNKELARYHITTKSLRSIKKDSDGNFWFITRDKGVYLYDTGNNRTTSFSASGTSDIRLHSNNVSDVIATQHNKVWIIYADGVFDGLDLAKTALTLRNDYLSRLNNNKTSQYSATMGSDGRLWIYIIENESGVYRYDIQHKSFDHIAKSTKGSGLNSNIINSIVQADAGTMWIGTDHGGINVVDLASGKTKYLLNRTDDPKSLRGNSVVLYKDNTGIIWAGTTKEGISYYHKGIIQFPLVRHYVMDNASLPSEDVDCFVEDAAGNLWIGTNGGGLIFFNRATKRYTQFRHDNGNANSLSNDIVINLFMDRQKNLWIGTYFGGLDKWDGKKFTHYRHYDKIPGSISDDRVYTIMEDSSNRLWVGTFAGALNIYNPATDDFTHPKYPMLSEYTAVIFEDRDKNIWIGRDKGIDVIVKRTGRVKHYTYQPGNKNSLIANDVNCIIQDRAGLMWIGTKEGISVLDANKGKFTNIDEAAGLPSNNVIGIVDDNAGRKWLTTANGIAAVQQKGDNGNFSYAISKYNSFDGLQSNEFNSNAFAKLRNGDIVLGGAHGFNIFDPQKIRSFGLKPALLLTDFQLFNRSVKVGDTIKGKVLLKTSISKAQSLVLDYDENVFNISFAACDYYNPDKIVYEYKLDGFDRDWLVSPNTSRKATYTNLDAGSYTFRVKAIDNNNPGSVSVQTLRIEILPPFWKTTLAYLLYAIAAISILFYIRYRGIKKLEKEFRVRQDKLEMERKMENERDAAQRVHELDLMKIKFFTNVSHEFRTPLSLIISPIDTLVKNLDKPEQKNQLLMIKRNGRRLLNLVNQLLDFRKMESRELKLNLDTGDIIRFIRETSESFTDLAGQNQVGYSIESDVDSLITRFDQDKIERILFNLLSNAFKFTPAGGNISVHLSAFFKATDEQEQQFLEIRVTDTGIGIAKEKLDRIFERFYQVNLPEGLLNQGSGIGLSITSEFVKMHSGRITAESEPGNGSSFTIHLPVKAENDTGVAGSGLPSPVVQELAQATKLSAESLKKPMVLVIDDNDDLRFYLKDNLKETFTIVEATNGKEGWQKALALHPKLIVSDVNMPEMNGLELCKKLKNDNRTSHIPVILLTALTEDDDQLTGLTNGANDYIGKPFNFEILLSKINSLLTMQEAFKKTYQKQREISVQTAQVVSEDEKFLKNVFDCIEKNITNHNFSVEELSRQISLNRVSLYKRLLSLTGKTPVDCIRTVRLKKAMYLLEKSKLSIAAIAYEVGFNNPTYFSKVFKDEYGIVPSEYFNGTKDKKEIDHLETS